jgi:hypothetical protein
MMNILQADDENMAYVESKLLEYNKQCVPSSQDIDYKKIDFIATDGPNIIGGISAYSVIWKILYVDTLWVDEDYRRQGIGRRLLESVCESAKSYGCELVHLSTFDFQGLEFYQAMGFKIFGVLDDSPKGHKEYFLSKKIC